MTDSDAISRVLGLLRQTDMTGDRKTLAEAIVTAVHLADQVPWKPAVGDAVIATLPDGEDLVAVVVKVGDRMARVEFHSPPPGVRNSYPLHINRLRPLVAETAGSTP